MAPAVTRFALVALGGSLGAVCRYLLSLAAAGLLGTPFPFGTLAANLIGCLLIGMAFALSGRLQLFSPQARLFFMTGLLGGLTTFSTYALETVNGIRGGAGLVAITNVVLSNCCGLLLVLAGMWLVNAVFKRE
jgi:CrcB protein